MENIPRKYKLYYDAVKQNTKLPMYWINFFLNGLYLENTKFKHTYPMNDELKNLYRTDIDFMLCISDVLMEYIIEMDTKYIEKMDSFINSYRYVLDVIYELNSVTPEQEEKFKSILNKM